MTDARRTDTWLPDLVVAASPAFSNRPFNPYTFLLYAAMARQGIRVFEYYPQSPFARDADVIHLHWPNGVLSKPGVLGCLFELVAQSALLAVHRRRGAKVFWTVHNVVPHEHRHKRLEGLFWRLFLPNVDAVIFLTRTSRRIATEAVPALADKPAYVIPHGHYRDIYDFPASARDARAALGLPAEGSVILAFGQVRRYKRLPELVRAVRNLDRTDVRLVIAGPLHPGDRDLGDDIRRAADGDPRVLVHLRYLTEDELARYLSASDLVVLTYGAVLNSGAAMLSLSADRPCLAPRMGSLVELQETFGDRWLRTYDGAIDAGVIADAVDWAAAAKGRTAPLDDYGWPAIAEATLDAYRKIIDAPPRSQDE